MPKDCPKCGLVNPPEAQRCDCGYDFVSQAAKQPRSSTLGQEASASTSQESSGRHLSHWASASFGLKMLIASQAGELVAAAMPALLDERPGIALGILGLLASVICYLIGLAYCSWIPEECGSRGLMTGAYVTSFVAYLFLGSIFSLHFLWWLAREYRPYSQVLAEFITSGWLVLIGLASILAFVGAILLLVGLGVTARRLDSPVLAQGVIVYGVLLLVVPLIFAVIALTQPKPDPFASYASYSEYQTRLETLQRSALAFAALMTIMFSVLVTAIGRLLEDRAKKLSS
jgi:hypothetical protein